MRNILLTHRIASYVFFVFNTCWVRGLEKRFPRAGTMTEFECWQNGCLVTCFALVVSTQQVCLVRPRNIRRLWIRFEEWINQPWIKRSTILHYTTTQYGVTMYFLLNVRLFTECWEIRQKTQNGGGGWRKSRSNHVVMTSRLETRSARSLDPKTTNKLFCYHYD